MAVPRARSGSGIGMTNAPENPDPASASDRFPPVDAAITRRFYDDLHAIAGRIFSQERTGHTLQPTAVVNEACMRIMASGLPDLPREQQLAIAGRVLKQVLVDHARGKNALKRGGGPAAAPGVRLDLEHDILEDQRTEVDVSRIGAALDRLRLLSERQAEVVTLRIFSGLTMDQIASVLGVAKRTVEGEWTVARAWLRRELARDDESDTGVGSAGGGRGR